MMNTRSHHQAFTLIELLAVIAIIGVLAAIVIPVTGKIRDSATDSKCRSNLRQLHAAIMGYATDTGMMPLRFHKDEKDANRLADGHTYTIETESELDTLTGNYLWYRNIYPRFLVNGGKIDSITKEHVWFSEPTVLASPDAFVPYFCPADSRKNTGAKTKAELDKLMVYTKTAPNKPGYGYNKHASYNDYSQNENLKRAMRPSEIVKNPVLLADSESEFLVVTTDADRDACLRFRHFCRFEYDLEAKQTGGSHGGSCNMVFFDGSVKSFREGKVPSLNGEIDGIKGADLWKPF